MGWRTNVALAVLVGGVGGYLYFNQVEKSKPGDHGDVGTTPLLPKGAWNARTVRFQYADNRPPIVLDLDLQNQKFRILEPVRDVASFAVLKSILDAYETANLVPGYTAEELAADPSLVKKTGLEEPLGKIEFRYPPDEKVVLEFGGPGVRDGVMWARVGAAIYRIDPALRSLLNKNPDDIREHLLFTDLSIGRFRKIRFDQRVDGQIETHVIEQRALGRVQIVEPVNARADPATFRQYLRSIGSLYIDRFISGAAQPRELTNPPDYQMSVAGDRGSETLDVRVLEDGTFFGFLRRRNINFALKKRRLLDLPRWLPALRQKRVVTLGEQEIQRIELDPGSPDGEKAVLIRSEQGFRIAAPIAIPKTNPTPIGELLHSLTHLVAKGFVDDPNLDTGTKGGEGYFTVRVGVLTGTGKQPVAIRIGKDAGNGLVYGKREDDEYGLLLAAEDLRPMRRPWVEFASRYVPPMTSNAFRVEVHVPGRKDPLVYVNEEFEWWRVDRGESSRGQPDAELAEFVDSLKTLRSGGIVPASKLNPQAPVVRVVLRQNTTAQSGEIYELSMRKNGEQVVLLIKGVGGVAYRVGQPFRGLFERWTKN